VQWYKSEGTYGSSRVYPAAGLPVHCFPYCGRVAAHLRPYVMVQFRGVTRKRRTFVACRVRNARNVGNTSSTAQQRDRLASTNFEFLIH